MYLEYRDITALSDAIKRPEVAWWMLDIAFPGLRKRINKNMAGIAESAPFKFAPENGLAFFEDLGWQTVEAQPLLHTAHRLRRLPIWMRPLAWLPRPDLRSPGNNPRVRSPSSRIELPNYQPAQRINRVKRASRRFFNAASPASYDRETRSDCGLFACQNAPADPRITACASRSNST